MVFTCEHGGNRIPRRYRAFFVTAGRALHSHRGFDRGALVIARLLSHGLKAPLYFSRTSRLLVDLNRSADNPAVFSEFSREIQADLISLFHMPYRRTVETAILAQRQVMHFSIHSFTPVLRGQKRAVHIGVLYDPRRSFEKRVALRLQRELQRRFPGWKIRLNAPYRGDGDGLTTYLRTQTAANAYSGIEIEFNYRVLKAVTSPAGRRKLLGALRATASLGVAVQQADE